MRGFFGTKCNDLTIGQTLVFTALATIISFAPLAIAYAAEKVSEMRRNRY